jgi:hypothetical protein
MNSELELQSFEFKRVHLTELQIYIMIMIGYFVSWRSATVPVMIIREVGNVDQKVTLPSTERISAGLGEMKEVMRCQTNLSGTLVDFICASVASEGGREMEICELIEMLRSHIGKCKPEPFELAVLHVFWVPKILGVLIGDRELRRAVRELYRNTIDNPNGIDVKLQGS